VPAEAAVGGERVGGDAGECGGGECGGYAGGRGSERGAPSNGDGVGAEREVALQLTGTQTSDVEEWRRVERRDRLEKREIGVAAPGEVYAEVRHERNVVGKGNLRR